MILEQEYGLDPAKLHRIPPGVPEVGRVMPDRLKQAMQFEGRAILSTFGLLSSGKGIQYVIKALPEVIKRHPDVLYLVLGEMHPEVRRQERSAGGVPEPEVLGPLDQPVVGEPGAPGVV